MTQTVVYLASTCQSKSQVKDSQQLGPDSSMIGDAGVALIINPAVITNSTDLFTVLRTLEQALRADRDVLDAGAQAPGIVLAKLDELKGSDQEHEQGRTARPGRESAKT